VVVADVADHEREQLREVAIHDLVGGDDAVLVVQPHVVLLRLIAREHGDAARTAHLAAQKAANEHLAEGAGPSGDYDVLAVERASVFEVH
jgi:hypothetical protein